MTTDIFAGMAKKAKDPIPGIILNQPLRDRGAQGDIGLELEMEGQFLPGGGDVAGIRAPKSGAQWDIHRDGSLRGESAEYVLTTPCYQEELRPLLDGLWSRFQQLGTRLNHSNRTSTHVHINIGGMKVNELTSYVGLWLMFEEALVNWCGEERIANQFCLREKDSNWLSKQWINSLETGRFGWSNDYKYNALNLAAMDRFGSFEFRTMRGANSAEEVYLWATLLYGLRQAAKTTYNNPMRLAEHLSEMGAAAMFRQICVDNGLETLYSEVLAVPENGDFDRMCLRSFRQFQLAVYQIDWYGIMDEINKDYVPNPFGKSKKRKTGRTNTILNWDEIERAERALRAEEGRVVNPVPPPLQNVTTTTATINPVTGRFN